METHSKLAATHNQDRTLHFTLSLYVDGDEDRDLTHKLFQGDMNKLRKIEEQLRFQHDFNDSLKLRDAIEPLLNDITDRERGGSVEDFFLCTPQHDAETITITCPKSITWTTEGNKLEAEFRNEISHEVAVRTFWYVHANGAVSYHMSFQLQYTHEADDFFFISMLQKVCAPKEFAPRASGEASFDCLEHSGGILPLKKIEVGPVNNRKTFWRYVHDKFQEHTRDLSKEWGVKIADEEESKIAKKNVPEYFAHFVGQDEFIEVPGLKMPRVRCLFLFRDRKFFNLLSRENRETIARNPECKALADDVREKLDKAAPKNSGVHHVLFNTEFIEYLANRPTALKYYFLSGFCQNIIDFLNQDASEIRDSLDPIYPTTPEQEEENFFFRFANPRAMVQFVSESRSLDLGSRYIGTCPYAFLVHVAAVHNEFLTRSFERKVKKLETKDANFNKHHKKTVETFYDFRRTTLQDYHRYKYENVFRYDTERDCFAALEDVRGTQRKADRLEKIVESLATMTNDLENRRSAKKTEQFTIILVAIGFFGILLVFFEIHKILESRPPNTLLRLLNFFDLSGDISEPMAIVLILFSVGLFVMLLASFLIFALYRTVIFLRTREGLWNYIPFHLKGARNAVKKIFGTISIEDPE